jgi:magnesium chelatase family protein
VDMAAVEWKELRTEQDGEGSDAIRARVLEARSRAARRRPGSSAFRNADLPAQELVQHCALDHGGARLLESAVTRVGLSVRAVHRALRVARTIADLAASERVSGSHLAEALSLRASSLTGNCPNEQVDSGRRRP